MALPDSIVQVRLFDTCVDALGNPATGHIDVFADVIIHNGAGGSVGPLNYRADLDEDGRFEVTVPATDSPGWGPANFRYTVKKSLNTGVEVWHILVPYDTPGLEICLSATVEVDDNVEPDLYVPISVGNSPGGYVQLDENGSQPGAHHTGSVVIEKRQVIVGDSLTIDAGIVSINAAESNRFSLLATEDFTLANPTNGEPDQQIVIRVQQDEVGGHGISFDTAWKFGTDLTAVILSAAAGLTDYISAISPDGVNWHVVSVVRGY